MDSTNQRQRVGSDSIPQTETLTSARTAEKLRVLLVEDCAPDVYLIREALRREGLDVDMKVAEDGEQAAQWLGNLDLSNEPWPNLILLDLNTPRCEGKELLQKIKRAPRGRSIPVIVITSSNSPADREDAFRFGASWYFRKPSDLNEFMEIGAVVRHILFGAGNGGPRG